VSNILNCIEGCDSKYRLKSYRPSSRTWAFLSSMDLELMAFMAVVKVKLIHTQMDLADYQKALSFATPGMEAFDILLKNAEELVKEIQFYENKLKEI